MKEDPLGILRSSLGIGSVRIGAVAGQLFPEITAASAIPFFGTENILDPLI
jgi:hypothetical protein